MNHCCEINCDKPAEFEIRGEQGDDDNTHACADHVGELLGTPDWADKENQRWTVTTLETTS